MFQGPKKSIGPFSSRFRKYFQRTQDEMIPMHQALGGVGFACGTGMAGMKNRSFSSSCRRREENRFTNVLDDDVGLFSSPE
ncbi:hypothetical protein Tco_1502970 [Tanacetum coccineum]